MQKSARRKTIKTIRSEGQGGMEKLKNTFLFGSRAEKVPDTDTEKCPRLALLTVGLLGWCRSFPSMFILLCCVVSRPSSLFHCDTAGGHTFVRKRTATQNKKKFRPRSLVFSFLGTTCHSNLLQLKLLSTACTGCHVASDQYGAAQGRG